MKTSPTWQQVALLAVLLTSILLAYALVAPAAGAITGIVTTIIGSAFLDLKGALPMAQDADKKAADPKDGAK